MRDTFIKKLQEIAERNDKIIFITGDLGFGVVDKYKNAIPAQFINAGVAEQNMTLIATGLALNGFISFTYSIGNFPTLRCLEMIRNGPAYHDLNVKVVSIGGGFSYGQLGVSHHATEDIAIMRAIPNITVVVPCNQWEVERATEAIAEKDGTFYLRLDKDSGCDVSTNTDFFELGRARVIKHGQKCAIYVCGGIISEVEIAVKMLGDRGIHPFIISMHTIKPIDVNNILSIGNQCDIILTVEEHSISGGLGGAIAEVLLSHGVTPKKFIRVGLKDCFSSVVGDQKYLRSVYGLDSVSIYNAVIKAWDENEKDF